MANVAEPTNKGVESNVGKPLADDIKDFLALHEPLVEVALSEFRGRAIPDSISTELEKYYEECLNYTIVGGKMLRGLTVLKGCETLLGTLDADQRFHASVLGWCVEWFQAMFLIADDVMDKSLTRRGRPCWYQLPHVTDVNGFNDAVVIESLTYALLKRYFRAQPCYVRLLELFREVVLTTEIGQHLDTNGSPIGQALDVGRFTMDRYRAIAQCKTAHYSFYLPCAVAMTFAGEDSDGTFDSARELCLELGEYFQVQDDYLDCFGDESTTGKAGTDIQDAKCTWLVCQAMLRASEAQRKVISENYGSWEMDKIGRVKAIYAELGLQHLYVEYQEEAKRRIEAKISVFEPARFRPVFMFLLHKIYKRSK